jgi:hypothetical protein
MHILRRCATILAKVTPYRNIAKNGGIKPLPKHTHATNSGVNKIVGNTASMVPN